MPNINYDRPRRKRQYICTHKHHRTSRNSNANKWISIEKERLTFDHADYGGFIEQDESKSWSDNEENLWGFVENFEDIGTQKEQFGYFPNPQNITDRWHGYPVIPFKKGYEISKELLQRWIDEGKIDADDIPHLVGRKRIR